MSRLKPIVGKAYQEIVLHRATPTSSFNMFRIAGNDPAFIDEVKARITEVAKVTQQCFISKQEHEFLKRALDHFNTRGPLTVTSPVIPAPKTPAPIATPTTKPQDHEDMTSKLSTLADLAKSTIAQVEADAEAEVNKLMAAKTRANAAVANVGNIRTGIESGAKDLEDFANQLTNGAPPLGS